MIEEKLENITPHQHLAQTLAAAFQPCAEVQAIALGGSRVGGMVDATSDIDLYVFTHGVIPLSRRIAIMQARGAICADMDLRFWDLGDEWFDAPTGIEIDVMYWNLTWASAQVERVLVQHQAWLGYTTSHWHTVKNLQSLFDPSGWLHDLQTQAAQPYPDILRDAIVTKNHAVLRNVIPSYYHQIEKAVNRSDLVSVNHRVAALLASYFDILFALNRQTNPGEKQLVRLVQQICARLPVNMAEEVQAVLRAAGAPERGLVDHLNHLLDSLDTFLHQEGFDPNSSQPLSAP